MQTSRSVLTVMNETNLQQRRKWFHFFPEGNLEFTVVTRTLMFLLLLIMLVVPERIRFYSIMMFAAVFFADYLLSLWWSIEIATDLNDLQSGQKATVEEKGRRRIAAVILDSLPCLFILLMVIPWARLIFSDPGSQQAVMRIAYPLLAVGLVAALILSMWMMRRIQMGPGLWGFLSLLPVLHWFALHRLISRFHQRLPQQNEGEKEADEVSAPGIALALADATWILSMLPWLAALALGIWRGQWPGDLPFAVAPVCGTAMLGLFLIANLAAMEHLQKLFVSVLQKSSSS
jgi:hypothetical protein